MSVVSSLCASLVESSRGVVGAPTGGGGGRDVGGCGGSRQPVSVDNGRAVLTF